MLAGKDILSEQWDFSQIAVALGGNAQNFLMNTKYFYPIYVISDIWKNVGGIQLFIWQRYQVLTRNSMKPLRLTEPADSGRCFTLLCRVAPDYHGSFYPAYGGLLNVGYKNPSSIFRGYL